MDIVESVVYFFCHYVLIRSQYALLRFVKLCYAVNTRSTTIAITLPQVLLRLPRSVLTLRHVLLSSVKFSHVHQVLLSSTTFHKHDWSTIAKIGAWLGIKGGRDSPSTILSRGLREERCIIEMRMILFVLSCFMHISWPRRKRSNNNNNIQNRAG